MTAARQRGNEVTPDTPTAKCGAGISAMGERDETRTEEARPTTNATFIAATSQSVETQRSHHVSVWKHWDQGGGELASLDRTPAKPRTLGATTSTEVEALTEEPAFSTLEWAARAQEKRAGRLQKAPGGGPEDQKWQRARMQTLTGEGVVEGHEYTG